MIPTLGYVAAVLEGAGQTWDLWEVDIFEYLSLEFRKIEKIVPTCVEATIELHVRRNKGRI